MFEMPDAPWVFDRPADLVERQMGEMTERVERWSGELLDIMGQMTQIGRFFPSEASPPVVVIPDLQIPNRAQVDEPNVALLGEITPFDKPEFQQLTFDDGFAFTDPPTFQPTLVSFVVPAPPAPISTGDAPARPTLNTITLPTRPDLPGVEPPALVTINVPTVVFPDLPTLELGPDPQYQGPTPSASISYVEPQYASAVLDATKQQVLRMLAGGTGLHPSIEAALFARAHVRQDAEAEKAVQDAHATFAARGYDLPPGALVAAVDEVRERTSLAKSALNRDILTQSAQWEIENLRTAVAQGVALETVLIGLHNSAAARALELARARVDVEISVANLFVTLFNAQQQARQVRVQIFDAQLRAALSRLEAQKLQIEAEGLKGQINEQQVRMYAARLDAVRNIVEVWRADVQGAQAQAELERSKVEIYRTEVTAWAERIRARSVEFDAYEARVRAEAAKAGLLDSESRAFAATVQAWSTGENVKIARIDARRQALLASVTKYQADLQSEGERVRAEVSGIQAKAEGFRADLGRYSAELQADTSERGMRLQLVEARVRNVLAGLEIVSRQYDSSQARLLQQAQVLSDTLKAQGAYAAQLAAGAMSAQHVQASLSGSGNASGSTSNSYSLSETRQL